MTPKKKEQKRTKHYWLNQSPLMFKADQALCNRQDRIIDVMKLTVSAIKCVLILLSGGMIGVMGEQGDMREWWLCGLRLFYFINNNTGIRLC